MAIRDDIIAIPDEDLRNARVSVEYLVFMDFVGSPKRFWTGWGDLVSDGEDWQGTGDLIKIPRLPASTADTAETVTFAVQGVKADMLNLARNSASQAQGQKVVVYKKFFQVSKSEIGVQDWSELMPAFEVYTGKMDQLSIRSSVGDDGNAVRTIDVTANGLFTNRNSPVSSRWTDADQQSRYPGDEGCSRMSIYSSYAPVWTPSN